MTPLVRRSLTVAWISVLAACGGVPAVGDVSGDTRSESATGDSGSGPDARSDVVGDIGSADATATDTQVTDVPAGDDAGADVPTPTDSVDDSTLADSTVTESGGSDSSMMDTGSTDSGDAGSMDGGTTDATSLDVGCRFRCPDGRCVGDPLICFADSGVVDTGRSDVVVPDVPAICPPPLLRCPDGRCVLLLSMCVPPPPDSGVVDSGTCAPCAAGLVCCPRIRLCYDPRCLACCPP